MENRKSKHPLQAFIVQFNFRLQTRISFCENISNPFLPPFPVHSESLSALERDCLLGDDAGRIRKRFQKTYFRSEIGWHRCYLQTPHLCNTSFPTKYDFEVRQKTLLRHTRGHVPFNVVI